MDQRRADTGRRAVKRLAALGPHPSGTVVLIYHRVGGGSGLEIDLQPEAFRRQLQSLSAEERVVPLSAAVESLTSATNPTTPRDDVVITFDDGTADFAEVALPLIVEHRVPVTLYVATGFIEEQRPFPDDGRPLSWAALRDACSTGFVDVGSHTHTHALLDRVSGDWVARELDQSKTLIEDRLGRACHDFAYPKALAPCPAADTAVRARFRSAALAGTRPNRPGRTDPYRLARSPIQTSDGMHYFEKKVAGGMRLEDDMRRTLNRWRYRGAES